MNGHDSDREYRSRVRAWTMYDWANSAFATTVLAAVLPIYYSQVAGATLPSAAAATAYWSISLSVSLFVVAIVSPILGTISDIMRGKKLLLAVFAGTGIVAIGLLVLVTTGDWLLASILFVFGRIGFAGANVFYDALLPHVAKKEEQDAVSTRGYAVGYLGGGILLAVNVVMIQLLPGTWGPRLSFLSVAVWWALFSIPLFVRVPEPKTLGGQDESQNTASALKMSLARLRNTFRDIRHYADLFLYLLAFLIYIDGVGTIISLASIYAAELGLGTIETILALLLVQFVGIPFSIIFGRLPSKGTRFRPAFLGLMLFNIVALPTAGLVGTRVLAPEVSGAPAAPFETTERAAGEGEYNATDPRLTFQGGWQTEQISADLIRTEQDQPYAVGNNPGDRITFTFNGQKVDIIHSKGPDHGIWAVEIDGRPLAQEGDQPFTIDAYQSTLRYEIRTSILADSPGEHTLSLINSSGSNNSSSGNRISVSRINVLPPLRTSNLGIIIAIIVGIEAVGILLGLLLGPALFSGLVERFTTKTCILLALLVYTVIAVLGFFLDSVIEFWVLAWMVATVQGGIQALSRSLYSSMIPRAKSGEFFGLFSIMQKFASILGPLVFAVAVGIFGSSRPAVLSLILFFAVGTVLLLRVNVERGRAVAQQEDAELEQDLD